MGLYSLLRSFLSGGSRGRLTRLLYVTGLKPRINRRVRSPFSTGTVVLSADFEMAWAFRFSRTRGGEAVEKGMQERKNVPLLLAMLEKHNLPVTWATVGHLLLHECRRGDAGRAHPEMPRPRFFSNSNWDFSGGDWYGHDPCTDLRHDPAWYASDLVDMVLQSGAGHEIGCHSFSHLDFTYAHCTKELADAELDECIRAAAVKDVKLSSMVFPGGTFGNYESLKEKGFICYRLPMKYHLDLCYRDEFGLVAIPSSLGLGRDQYGWSPEFHLRVIEQFLKKAARYKLICHFWFHPSVDQWYLDRVMPSVLELIASYRDSKRVTVRTMGELAREYLRLTE